MRVDGLDGIYIGPNDLALALGAPPTSAPTGEMRAIIDGILKETHDAGKIAGIFTNDGQVALDMSASGFDVVNVGIDTAWLVGNAQTHLAAARGRKP